MSNTRVGVSTSSTLPAIALTSVIAISRRGEIPPTGPISFRNAHTLAVEPGSNATLDVALAILAGNTSALSAGSVAHVPPPALALNSAPRSPAAAGTDIGAARRSSKDVTYTNRHQANDR